MTKNGYLGMIGDSTHNIIGGIKSLFFILYAY